MRFLGRLFVFIGVILLLIGIIGFYYASSSGLSDGMLDTMLRAGNAVGITRQLDAGDQLKLYVTQYRSTCAVAGGASLLLGIALGLGARRR